MIIKIDTANRHLIYDDKILHVDLFAALAMAQVGHKIEVIQIGTDAVVTVKLTMESNEPRF